MAALNNKAKGENLWKNTEKVNAEFFSLTYGSLVAQIVKDYEEVDAINAQLEKMGHNIGVRLIDEFLAKSQAGRNPCKSNRDIAEVVCKVAFKMFLNINAEPTNWDADSAFSIVYGDSPLTDFVQLPPHLQDLHYSNIICGVIRGALEMIQIQVEATYVGDKLRGAEQNEIRVVSV